MRIIDKIAWIHIKDGKILMLRSKGKDKPYFPGGKREAGENDLEALTRELKEELGIDFTPKTAVLLTRLSAPAHGQSEPTEVQCAFYTGDCEGEFIPQSEIEEAIWLSAEEMQSLTPLSVLLVNFLKESQMIS
ncbi:MAG: NUDIX domain-containing protein [Minisyncoccia bacterium]